MTFYEFTYKHFLSKLDPEWIHDAVVGGLRIAGQIAPARALMRSLYGVPSMPVEALGMTFDHPLGMAGGFDKEGECLAATAALGFSFVEVGTVTPHPQPGNPKPRIFRLVEDQGLINRMGFPGKGMDVLARNLERQRVPGLRIGISLGKNKDTPLADAHADYSAGLRRLYAPGDFFAINVSSPNTPELRKLQSSEYLSELLARLRAQIGELAGDDRPKPLLVKISPDLGWDEIDELLDLSLQHGVAGIIATNTTRSREDLRGKNRGEEGGLSGAPLRERSTAVIRHIREQVGNRLTIIGVGGVFSGDDLREKLDAGATLVQAYTGFIYRGPAFVKRVMSEYGDSIR
ncbi:MAG: quinone-dependent dihydroorotate dehydrogenase [Anaerolineae bacterium]|nr:quinone-dependent dihydroorotate dehydrogenase [Anaerolineae bacterium]